jgi:hypothetical protein
MFWRFHQRVKIIGTEIAKNESTKFYAVVDRTPRDFPWLNEPDGGILPGWML